MRRLVRTASRLAPALLALGLVSCAVSGGPTPASAPRSTVDRAWNSPIRENMLPEYRVFYDMLEGEGDWVLIEPYGYVFRPDVNFVAWHPYENGYWVPSDAWGWVWVSTDRFGWATDHYGRWLDDNFQGWVWVPDVVWGPSWVDWAGDDDYVGWAPMMAASSGYDSGAWTFVPLGALPATDVGAHVVNPAALRTKSESLKPLGRVVEHDGRRVQAGPRFDWVERKTGPLAKVRVEDAVAPGTLRFVRTPGGATRATYPPDTSRADHAARLKARLEAERATDEARDHTRPGVEPLQRLPVVRPFEPPARSAQPPLHPRFDPPGGASH